MSRIVATVFVLLLAACTSSVTTDCNKGDKCACDGSGACTWNCVGAGCTFTASGQGAASLTCPGGSCTLNASGTGATNMSCAGGKCTVTATGSGAVELSCKGGGCTVNCQGTGACHVSDCPTCTCNSSSVTAPCSAD